MRGFAIIIDDRGEDRCIAVFSQKFRARSFVSHLKKADPYQNPRMIDVDLSGELYLLLK